MTQKDKELLLKDLTARLTYGVIVHLDYRDGTIVTREMGIGSFHDILFDNTKGKPYLRSLSSMTAEEREKYRYGFGSDTYGNVKKIDWLNAHHFDYRGLIEKGLALEAPEGMYKIK